ARLPQQTDRAPSPFESLLDDGVQAADQPAPTSPESKLAPADNSLAQAKPNDCKPMVANDNGNIKQQHNIDPLGSADAGGKAKSGSKIIMDGKLVESIATGDDTKAADGGKPADEQKTKSPTVTPQTDTTIIATEAIVATPPASAPAPDKGHQGGQCSQQLTQATGALLPL